jgi:hypothetical protein
MFSFTIVLGTKYSLVVSFPPRPLYLRQKSSSVYIRKEAGWAPVPIETLWSRERYFSLPGIKPGPPIPYTITTLTELSGLFV